MTNEELAIKIIKEETNLNEFQVIKELRQTARLSIFQAKEVLQKLVDEDIIIIDQKDYAVLLKNQLCNWNYSETDDSWETGCSNKFQLNSDSPFENGFSYCPYCGKEIIEN